MEKLRVLNRDAVKYIAIFFMFWGHLIGAFLELKDGSPMYTLPPLVELVGNLSLVCPPVMFFMVGDGYRYSHDRKKYALRLLIFAALTQLSIFFVFKSMTYANVIFTMLFGLVEISVWESGLRKWKKIALISLLIAAGVLIGCEWGFFGDLAIIFLYIWRDSPKKRFIAFSSLMLLWQGLALFYNPPLGCIERFAAVILSYAFITVFYNGKKGHFPKFSKWFFYFFYPLHYLIIYAIYLI